MKKGDLVEVYPVGHPEQGVRASIAIISKNELSIALSLEDKPAFLSLAQGVFMNGSGIVLFAFRRSRAHSWAELNTHERLAIVDQQRKEN